MVGFNKKQNIAKYILESALVVSVPQKRYRTNQKTSETYGCLACFL